jgi:signal transduction histidine kinase
VWTRRRFRIPLPDGHADGGTAACADLVAWLGGLPGARDAGETARDCIDRFLRLAATKQPAALPALYLLLEQEIVEASGPGGAAATRADLHRIVAERFAPLLAADDFALIFTPPIRQELLLCRRLLLSTVEHAVAMLGAAGNDALGALAGWLEAAPGTRAKPPFELAQVPPGSDSEWVTLFFRFARALYLYLENKLGENRARSFYERGYNAVADRYALLETFPVVVNLLPEKLLDSEKIGRLSRSQIQKVLLRKLEELNGINGQLRLQYEELDAARHEVDKARDELEARVTERTAALVSANAQLRREIEERERAEQGLRAAKEAADLANRAKSEFLANMSHELRTPLNAVIGFSEILKDSPFGPLPQPQYEAYARDIHASGQHLLSIINDMLDMAKVEAGKTELQEQAVDLEATIAAALRVVQARAAAGAIGLQTGIAPGLAALWGDERLIRQVLLNLLSNAVKFTPAGGSVRVEAAREPSGRTVLRIRDTGIGIAPEHIAKVLIPFGQVESALSRSHGGTGLGLPRARSFVELHGGTLALECAIGAGTTVTLRFPAERTIAAAEPGRRATGTDG